MEISVELVDAADKSHIWGKQYDFGFSHILEIKKNIFLGVAESLKLERSDFKKNIINGQEKINSDAFRFYLKGKYILETISTRNDLKKDLNQALRFFRNALKINPDYALAHVGIGETYILMFHHNASEKLVCYSEAKKSLQLALNLDNRLSEAHSLKGTLNVTFELNISEAKRSLTHAINLNENNSEAYNWLSFVNLCSGDFETALALQKKAVRLDPTSISFNNGLLRVFY